MVGAKLLPDLQVLGSKGRSVTFPQKFMDMSSAAWPLMGSQLIFRRAKDWELGDV